MKAERHSTRTRRPIDGRYTWKSCALLGLFFILPVAPITLDYGGFERGLYTDCDAMERGRFNLFFFREKEKKIKAILSRFFFFVLLSACCNSQQPAFDLDCLLPLFLFFLSGGDW